MSLRVTTIHGLTPTYLDSCTTSLRRLTPGTISLTYFRTGESDQPLQVTIADDSGVLSTDYVRMAHECLSCLVREHTYEELRRLDSLQRWDHALVTFPPGVDPGAFPSLVDAFQEDDAPEFTLVVDTALAVIDALLLDEQLRSATLLRDWDIAVFGRDERTLGEVLARQIEFSDRLLLANVDRLQPGMRAKVTELLTFLNDEADHIELDSQGECWVPSIGLQRFDLDAPRRCSPLGSDIAPEPATGDYFQSIIWLRDRPIHPARLADALEETLPGAVRSRGQLWFATHPEKQIGWESSGPMCSIASVLRWEHVPTGAECFLHLVGENLDQRGIIEALDATLLTDEEMAESLDVWRTYANPFAADLGFNEVIEEQENQE
jgi:G3E family GTPase